MLVIQLFFHKYIGNMNSKLNNNLGEIFLPNEISEYYFASEVRNMSSFISFHKDIGYRPPSGPL